MMEQEQAIFKAKGLFDHLTAMVQEAAENGEAINQVEGALWQGLLNLGLLLLQSYVEEQGTGDLGPTIEHQDKTLKRLESLHEKRYVSVFGEIRIARTVYGTRESHKHEMVPLDAQLNLSEGDFSFFTARLVANLLRPRFVQTIQ